VRLEKDIATIVYVLLGISPASICSCSWPAFRNPVSVPSSKAGCRLRCEGRQGIYTVSGFGPVCGRPIEGCSVRWWAVQGRWVGVEGEV
jgi:hypothetical protein